MTQLPEPIVNLISKVSSQGYVKSQEYINAAFEMNVRLIPLEQEYRQLAQEVAKTRLMILNQQTKRNVAAADVELETTDQYRELHELEDLIEHVKRSIQIAKKASDLI